MDERDGKTYRIETFVSHTWMIEDLEFESGKISGFANSKSDLDLAVLVEGYAEPVLLWNLANGEFADMAKMLVDLLYLRVASIVMQHQVLTTGNRLYAKNSIADSYEAFIFSEKFSLDEKKKDLLNDIKKRGVVYG